MLNVENGGVAIPACPFGAGVESLPSFDTRPQAELCETIASHSDRVERERALWELGHRSPDTAARMIRQVLQNDPDASIRWNALSLALKLAPGQTLSLIRVALMDDHREVRDWARVHLAQRAGEKLPGEYTAVTCMENERFDQALPLQFGGAALLHVPDAGWMRMTLSPLWFESIMGRAVAFIRLKPSPRELTIETCLANYHDDGTNHYETFLFTGLSWPSAANRMQHRYESNSLRRFHPSGKVDERSKGVVEVPVVVNVTAETTTIGIDGLPAVKSARLARLLNRDVVSTITGEFSGFAHTSLEHYARHGAILPGTVQMASSSDLFTVSLVNTYLCGAFWGKLGDHNGDGKIDLNTIPFHGIASADLNTGISPAFSDFPA
jgi:hypothetical protein